MALTYEWDCKTLDTYPSKTDNREPATTQLDVIYAVHWKLTAKKSYYNKKYEETIIGVQELNVENLTEFKAFSKITHAEVIGWVESALGTQLIEEYKDRLREDINQKINPITVVRHLEDA